MISGIGSDIIEIERIREILTHHGSTFLDKILTLNEKAYCQTMRDMAPTLAGRFSGKEAVAKALGTGFGEHLDFHDVEILNDEMGKPNVFLSPKAAKYFGNPRLHITISHCKSHAIAFCYSEKG